MSLKSRIYFSPLFYLIHYLGVVRKLLGLGSPFMLYGLYDRNTHKFLKRCRIASTAIITNNENLRLEDNVWINHYSRIDAAGGVSIGEGCQIGFGACVLSHSTHQSVRLMGIKFMEYDAPSRAGYVARHTSIGRYSFIGGGSYILPGVTIGEGCVVGVNSVVTRDVPDHAIVAGSPAKIIGSTRETDKKFFDNDLVKRYYYDPIFLHSQDNRK